MEDTAEKGGEIERRNPKIEATRRELSADGRQAHLRYPEGNVRSYLWFNHLDEGVPAYVEQLRYYAGKRDWNTTRLYEASDLRHASFGLEKTFRAAEKLRLMGRRPPNLGRDVVEKTVRKDLSPEWKFYHSGNIAMIARNNPADEFDFVLKADLVCVAAPDVLKRYFLPSQIVDAQSCLLQVGQQLLRDYREMEKRWNRLQP